jgi:crotonobetainyl-CoA:carnitine CoA-transferase CaiB-like acyl-CoA transferase
MAVDATLESGCAPPLADLRVVAVEQYGAGPWGTMQLADLGADVIKVEDPVSGGDVGRYVPPYQRGTDSLFFESFNRGKRSAVLDLRQVEGRAAFEALAGSADAVFCNLRGDAPAKLGLLYDDLSHVNERLVCCSLSAFGLTGPRMAEGGYDFTIQGLAGWQSITGAPGDPPMRSGLSLVDFIGGYVAALAVVSGVWQARRTGRGGDVDLSLFETALAQLNYLGTWVASRGYQPLRRQRSAHQSLVPFGNFPTADGWIVIACPKETLWRNLCRALDRSEWTTDPRFTTFSDRGVHREELTGLLDGILGTAPTTHWVERLTRNGVPCASINDIPAALADPQAVAREAVQTATHPRLGSVKQVRTPFRMPGLNPRARPAPGLGEHTEAVLRELCGYDDDRARQVAQLARLGS